MASVSKACLLPCSPGKKLHLLPFFINFIKKHKTFSDGTLSFEFPCPDLFLPLLLQHLHELRSVKWPVNWAAGSWFLLSYSAVSPLAFQVQKPACWRQVAPSLGRAQLSNMFNFWSHSFLHSVTLFCVQSSCIVQPYCAACHLLDGTASRSWSSVTLLFCEVLPPMHHVTRLSRGVLERTWDVITCTLKQTSCAGSAARTKGNLPIPPGKENSF